MIILIHTPFYFSSCVNYRESKSEFVCQECWRKFHVTLTSNTSTSETHARTENSLREWRSSFKETATQHADTRSDDGGHKTPLKIIHHLKTKRLGFSIKRSFFSHIYRPTHDAKTTYYYIQGGPKKGAILKRDHFKIIHPF